MCIGKTMKAIAAVNCSVVVLLLRAAVTDGFVLPSILRSSLLPHVRSRRSCSAVAMCAAPSLHQGLEQLADKCDAFLIDQWGVMHDGKTAYPKAIDCMSRLAAMGKKIVLLSNSSRRKGNSMKKLDKMGFDSNTIIDLVTSGEMGWQGLATKVAERQPPFEEIRGNKVFVFGNGEEDEEYVTSAGLEFATIEEADFILARGMFTMHDNEDVLYREGEKKVNYWESEATRCLQIASQTQKPMLVTNPDFVRPDGNDSPMPGKIATSYEVWTGNPKAEPHIPKP